MALSKSYGDGTSTIVELPSVFHYDKGVDLALAVPELDDFELMQRISRGNEAALGELYDRHSRLIFSVAYAVVQNRETAKEVTLDIFTHVWEKAGEYDPQLAKVRTWMTRMTRNRAIDRLRMENARPLQDSVLWADVTTEPVTEQNPTETTTHLSMEKQRVRAAVATLPPEQKEVLALAFLKVTVTAKLPGNLIYPSVR